MEAHKRDSIIAPEGSEAQTLNRRHVIKGFRTVDQGSEGDIQDAEDPKMGGRRSSPGEDLGDSDSSGTMCKSLR